MFPSTVSVKDADGNELVTSYALHRPDGNWAIMLVNRDESQAHKVRVEFVDVKFAHWIFRSGCSHDLRQRAVRVEG